MRSVYQLVTSKPASSPKQRWNRGRCLTAARTHPAHLELLAASWSLDVSILPWPRAATHPNHICDILLALILGLKIKTAEGSLGEFLNRLLFTLHVRSLLSRLIVGLISSCLFLFWSEHLCFHNQRETKKHGTIKSFWTELLLRLLSVEAISKCSLDGGCRGTGLEERKQQCNKAVRLSGEE